MLNDELCNYIWSPDSVCPISTQIGHDHFSGVISDYLQSALPHPEAFKLDMKSLLVLFPISLCKKRTKSISYVGHQVISAGYPLVEIAIKGNCE